MSRAIRTDKARSIDRETDRQALDGDVVDHLIIGTLQEGGIDRCEGSETFGGETSGKCHRMLLGDADIEAAAGKLLREKIEAGAGRHCARDRDDLVVFARLFYQALAENLRVLRCV